MSNIGQGIFLFFVGELVSGIIALIIKDEKRRIRFLIIGTILSGVLAIGFRSITILPIPPAKITSAQPPIVQATFTDSAVVLTKTQVLS